MDSIIVALITGGVTLVGVLLANNKTQAITETKLEELTREVREHNDFARRVPLLEQKYETHDVLIRELQSLHERQ